jgi:NAD(P)-dependent dehydrogenase (short-subunit alcohol dehydrogenase family)
MGAKEHISGGYIDSWHALTKDWEVPDVEDRAALVIGCREGNIGEAIYNELSEAGFGRVHSRDLNAPALAVDIADNTDLRAIPFHKYDTLILANGETNLDWIEDQPLAKIDSVIRNKLTGSIKAVRMFASANMETPHIKHIVLIGSMAHRSVLNGSAAYCAACAGLNHFARCVAWELAPKGFRVFIVNPSNVEGTPMTEETIKGLMKYRGLERDQAEEYWSAVRALPEWLKREDIATIVNDLVCDEAYRWMAGVPLDLGGGTR